MENKKTYFYEPHKKYTIVLQPFRGRNVFLSSFDTITHALAVKEKTESVVLFLDYSDSSDTKLLLLKTSFEEVGKNTVMDQAAFKTMCPEYKELYYLTAAAFIPFLLVQDAASGMDIEHSSFYHHSNGILKYILDVHGVSTSNNKVGLEHGIIIEEGRIVVDLDMAEKLSVYRVFTGRDTSIEDKTPWRYFSLHTNLMVALKHSHPYIAKNKKEALIKRAEKILSRKKDKEIFRQALNSKESTEKVKEAFNTSINSIFNDAINELYGTTNSSFDIVDEVEFTELGYEDNEGYVYYCENTTLVQDMALNIFESIFFKNSSLLKLPKGPHTKKQVLYISKKMLQKAEDLLTFYKSESKDEKGLASISGLFSDKGISAEYLDIIETEFLPGSLNYSEYS